MAYYWAMAHRLKTSGIGYTVAILVIFHLTNLSDPAIFVILRPGVHAHNLSESMSYHNTSFLPLLKITRNITLLQQH